MTDSILIQDYMTTKMKVLEERIFDKNKSSMFYHTQYLIMTFVDPDGVLPEKDMVAFIYDQTVIELLDNTQWKNRWNDAEYRSMKEIIDLRMHNRFFNDVSGTPMLS